MTRLGIAPALGLALTFTVTLNLVACGRDTGPVFAKPAATAPAIGPSSPAGVVPNPSVPDATSAFAGQDATERAKAMQADKTALNKFSPPSTMSKEQESKAMPLPGQANDHSTPGRDDKRPTSRAK